MAFLNRLLILCADHHMLEVARELQAAANFVIDIGEIQWGTFEHHFSNTRIVTDVRGRDVLFLASFGDENEIQRQLGVLYAIPRYGARSLRVVIPFFPGTMDRIRRPGDIVTAKTFARQLSAIPFCRGTGPAEIVIFDIHQTAEEFYFGDNVLVRLESAIPLLRSKIKTNPHGFDRVSVCFPDDGARKRFEDQFQGIPAIVCAKARPDGLNAKVVVMAGEAKGRWVWIVDDQIRGGTTMCDAARALREAGATFIGAFAPHYCAAEPVSERGGERPLRTDQMFGRAGFDWVTVTNSHPSSQSLRDLPGFEVLSLAPLLLPIIREE